MGGKVISDEWAKMCGDLSYGKLSSGRTRTFLPGITDCARLALRTRNAGLWRGGKGKGRA